MNVLSVKNISCRYGSVNVLSDINVCVEKRAFVGVIGPNGCGKSTFLKHIYGVYSTKTGAIFLNDENIRTIPQKALATKMATVGQENDTNFDFSVQEAVLMGRGPHKKLFEPDSDYDMYTVDKALEKTGIQHLAHRSILSLSGGEKQRVIIARALAQEPQLLILDEPTNHLDIAFQLQVLDIVKNLGISVLAAIHDLNLAAMYCDKIYMLHNHSVYCHGTPRQTLTEKNIKEVFGVDADISIHPATKQLHVAYFPNSHYNKKLLGVVV